MKYFALLVKTQGKYDLHYVFMTDDISEAKRKLNEIIKNTKSPFHTFTKAIICQNDGDAYKAIYAKQGTGAWALVEPYYYKFFPAKKTKSSQKKEYGYYTATARKDGTTSEMHTADIESA